MTRLGLVSALILSFAATAAPAALAAPAPLRITSSSIRDGRLAFTVTILNEPLTRYDGRKP
jgi:hypothetical protein